MAVIGRRIFLLGAVAPCLFADPSQDALQVVNHVATALSGGDPAEAIRPFARSFAKREDLENDFRALTASYELSNEADVLAEEDAPSVVRLTLRWTVTFTRTQSQFNRQRSEEVHVVLSKDRGKWAIVDFSPIAIFAPQGV